MRLILASHSIGRADLLTDAGYEFEQIPSNAEEPPRQKGEPIEGYVQRLAEIKMHYIAKRHPDAFVVAADTVLFFQNQVIGKPKDRGDAVRIISKLQGNSHDVVSGYAAKGPSGNWFSGADTARVTFVRLSEAEVEDYVDRANPLRFAGAYALQGEGAELVARVDGDESTVIGFALKDVEAALRELGFKAP